MAVKHSRTCAYDAADNSVDVRRMMTLPAPAMPNQSSARAKYLALGAACLALAARLAFIGSPGYAEDLAQFVAWAEISRDGSRISPPGGLPMVYAERPGGSGRSWSNYPPGYLIVLRGLATVHDLIAPESEPLSLDLIRRIRAGSDDAGVRRAMWVFKSPAVIADAVIAALLLLWVRRRLDERSAVIAGVVYALAPPMIWDSAAWGQVESVFVLPLLVAIEMGSRGRVEATAFWASTAFMFKAQAAMAAPLIVLLAWQYAGVDVKRWSRIVLAALVPAAAITLPFISQSGGLWRAYAGAASYYPFTHLNGFSAWFLSSPLLAPQLETMASSYSRDTTPLFAGMSARMIGGVCLLGSWIVVGTRLLRGRCDASVLQWAVRVLPICFFVFSTQMHERYIVPAVALWLWAFNHDRRWWLGFSLVLLVSTLNMLWVWPGSGESDWTDLWGIVLRRNWLGIAPGQWCASAITILGIGMLVIGPMDRRSSETARDESTGAEIGVQAS